MFNLVKVGLKALGFSSWTGTGTLLLGVIVILGSCAAWIREDAIKDTNAAWNIKLTETRLMMQRAIDEKTSKIKELEQKLVIDEVKTDAQANADKEKLNDQRDQTQLSVDCTRCRVPNARIWLRPNNGGNVSAQPVATKPAPAAKN